MPLGPIFNTSVMPDLVGVMPSFIPTHLRVAQLVLCSPSRVGISDTSLSFTASSSELTADLPCFTRPLFDLVFTEGRIAWSEHVRKLSFS